jgi:uncharacterized membrane protein YbhN (UPF0104 family)
MDQAPAIEARGGEMPIIFAVAFCAIVAILFSVIFGKCKDMNESIKETESAIKKLVKEKGE